MGIIDIPLFSSTTRPPEYPRDLEAEADFRERLDKAWLEEFGEERRGGKQSVCVGTVKARRRPARSRLRGPDTC